jgi:hypothetical protein
VGGSLHTFFTDLRDGFTLVRFLSGRCQKSVLPVCDDVYITNTQHRMRYKKMANISKTPLTQHTGRFGNTWYYAGAKGTSADGTRAGGLGAVAVDIGSDGTLNGGLIAGAGVGPNGAIGGVAGTGAEGYFGRAAALDANGQLAQTWQRFLPY